MKRNKEHMPNSTPLFRQTAIIKAIQELTAPSFLQIQKKVEAELIRQNDVVGNVKTSFGKRTFERDLKDIYTLYHAEIRYSTSKKGYVLEGQEEVQTEAFTKMLQAFDVVNAFRLSQTIAPFVAMQTRTPKGTEHLHGMLHCIQQRFKIGFSHQKFWETEVTQRLVNPLGLKEYRERWYLIAEDNKDGKVKAFGLDRISALDVTSKKFTPPKDYNALEKFKNCFGIISPDTGEPENIILSFSAFQAKYIKSLPLHASQQVILENKNEVRISLKLYPTHDFLMELLSFGAEVKVLEPKSLAREIKARYQKALEQYTKK